MKKEMLDRMPRLGSIMTITANVLFLCYLMVFAWARQSPELFAAAGIDLLAFAVLVSYRAWKRTTRSYTQEQTSLAKIERSLRFVYVGRRIFSSSVALVLGLTCAYLVADLAALVSAASGNVGLSQRIYLLLAPPKQLAIHPAFSMELLAGAYIEAGKYQMAEPLEQALLEIRQTTYGPRSEEIAAMYASIGDFCRRRRFDQEAEAWYRKAILLTQELHLAQGYGSPMTKLACLLRDQRRFPESHDCFEKALKIRTSIFGPLSTKVAETKSEYAVLLSLQGRAQPAADIREQSRKIVESHHGTKPTGDYLLLALPVVACVLACLRGRLMSLLASWTSASDRSASLQHSGRDYRSYFFGLVGFVFALRTKPGNHHS